MQEYADYLDTLREKGATGGIKGKTRPRPCSRDSSLRAGPLFLVTMNCYGFMRDILKPQYFQKTCQENFCVVFVPAGQYRTLPEYAFSMERQRRKKR